MRFSIFVFLSLSLVSSAAFGADDAPYNSATISGLGARNIGSATMSGRISAIAGVKEPSGKITLFVGAASGGVWKSDDSGTRYRPVFDEQPVQSIGASPSIRKIPRTSGSARANPGRVTASQLATASTSRTMAARPGPTRDCRNRNASPKSSLVRKTATLFLPPCRGHFGATRPTVDFIAPPTAARIGKSPSRAAILPPDAPLL